MPKISKDDKLPEVDWTDENKKHLVDAMADEITKHGRLADNGTWKTEQLTRITTAFNAAKGGPKYDKTQLSTQIGQLKKDYLIMKTLLEQSGFGYEGNTGLVTATSDVWERYVEKHKEAKKFRTKAFPLYDSLDDIYTGQLATGEYAVSSATGKSKRKRDDHDAAILASDDESSPRRSSPRLAERNQRSGSIGSPGDDNIDNGGSSSSSSSSSSSAVSAATTSGNSTISKQSGSGKTSTKSGREPPKKKGNEIIELLSTIASNQTKGTVLQQALEASKQYTAHLSVADRISFSRALSAQSGLAEMFLAEGDEGRRYLVQDNTVLQQPDDF